LESTNWENENEIGDSRFREEGDVIEEGEEIRKRENIFWVYVFFIVFPFTNNC